MVTEVRVHVVQVLDDALRPLEAVLAERAPAVQRHHLVQVLQALIAHLQKSFR